VRNEILLHLFHFAHARFIRRFSRFRIRLWTINQVSSAAAAITAAYVATVGTSVLDLVDFSLLRMVLDVESQLACSFGLVVAVFSRVFKMMFAFGFGSRYARDSTIFVEDSAAGWRGREADEMSQSTRLAKSGAFHDVPKLRRCRQSRS